MREGQGVCSSSLEPEVGTRAIRQALADLFAAQTTEAVVGLSAGGIVLSWNAGARALYGWSAEEAERHPFVDLVVPPQRRDELLNALEATLTSGSLVHRTERRTRDGSSVVVESRLTLVRTPEGGAWFVAVMERDLAELLRIARAEASEAMSRGLLEAAPDAMVVVGADGKIALVNRQLERVFGYEREELLGQPLTMLIPDRFRAVHGQHHADYFRSPRPRPMGSGLDLSGRRKDGSVFPVEISLSPMRSEQGLLVTAAIRDVTERKQAEEAIRTLNRELEAFSYSVSHDLRAPLRAIDGFSQVIQEDYQDKLDAMGRGYLERIRQASQRMGLLIDDLLRLSRITRAELRWASVDLSAACGAIAADLDERDPARRVRWEIAPDLTVNGDRQLLRIMLENLLVNAWKFTRDRAEAVVSVGAQEQNGERVFFVKDNGLGFDMAYASKLFVPFQRLHNQADFEGTGVGLATVQRILHKHGGRAWAESAPGAGATFYFTLDAARAAPPEPAA